MRPERWQLIEEIFNSALELEPGQRDAYLLQACGGDEGLRSQIERLLLRQTEAEPFLESLEAGTARGSLSKAGLPRGTDLTNQTVLHYQIAEKIGEGGMGVVYRAKDLRLGRVVALKFLHGYLSSDYQALERLQREARAASALDHPHVCKVYDIAEHDHRTFLVLEHLAGETLAERMKKGPLPLELALEIGVQVAGALDAAHKQGITHRDLKPGNVMLTKSGAKLLDFGLAKVNRNGARSAPSRESSACDPISLTVDGALLGTVPYMAPEQVEGRPADTRSDIWALGVMLYEMLAGKRPFDGTSQASLIAAILEHDPAPLATAQPLAPPLLDHLLTCCLAKNPDARWESAHDLAEQLRFIQSGGTGSQAGETRQRSGTRRWTTIGGLIAATLALLAAALLVLRPELVSRPSMRLTITLPADAPLAPGGLMPQAHDRPTLALSPDGSSLAYVAQVGKKTQIYTRDMTTGRVAPLLGTVGGHTPFFSPDGASIGFFADGKLKRISSGGGSIITLTDAPAPYGGAWGTDGSIYLNRQSTEGIHKIEADGGPVQVVATGTYRMPELLGIGPGLLATSGTGTVYLDHSTSRLLVAGFGARYVPTGHLVYSVGSRLVGVPFDRSRIEVTGPAVSLFEDLRTAPFGVAQFTFSLDGTLVYASGHPQALTSFVRVDRKGDRQPLGLPTQNYSAVDLSPDGRRLAFAVDDTRERGESDIWIHDLALGTTSRLTTRVSVGSPALNLYPCWTPDSRHLVYFRRTGGQFQLIWQAVEGSPTEVELWSAKPNGPQYLYPMSFSPDGSVLTVFGPSKNSSFDIFVMRMEGVDPPSTNGPELFLGNPYGEYFGQISPDGHWMLYASDQSGRNEVYVTTYPRPGTVHQISRDGGHKPLWNPGSSEIVYRSGTRMYAVEVNLVRGFRAGEPRLLFEGPYPNVPGFDFDITPDGQHFLMLENNDFLTPSATLTVITNFLDELRRRVPRGRGKK